jgi:hypothetical protein
MSHRVERFSDAGIDLDEFVGRMLPAFRAEIEGAGADLAETVRASVSCSGDECYVGFIDDTPVVLFGAVMYEGCANVWVMQASGYERALIAFMRAGKEASDIWARRYGVIFGHIKSHNEKMIRWAVWCGFAVAGVTPNGYTEVVKRWA